MKFILIVFFLRNYLEWMIDLPWSKETKDKLDIPQARWGTKYAVDIGFRKYQYEHLCHFGVKESIPGVLYVSFFREGSSHPYPNILLYIYICIFTELQDIEEIYKINYILILFISNELFSFIAIFLRLDLDQDHYGLEKLKKRVIEYLAVRKLKNSLKGKIQQ